MMCAALSYKHNITSKISILSLIALLGLTEGMKVDQRLSSDCVPTCIWRRIRLQPQQKQHIAT